MAENAAQLAWLISATGMNWNAIVEKLSQRSPGTQGAVLNLLRSSNWPDVETLASMLPNARYEQYYQGGGYTLPTYTPPDNPAPYLPPGAYPYTPYGPGGVAPQPPPQPAPVYPYTPYGPGGAPPQLQPQPIYQQQPAYQPQPVYQPGPVYPNTSYGPGGAPPQQQPGPPHSYNPYQNQAVPSQAMPWASSSSQPASPPAEYPGARLARLTNPRLPPLAPGGACATMTASFLKRSFNSRSVFTSSIESILRPTDYVNAQARYEELAGDGDLESDSLFAPLGLVEESHNSYDNPIESTWYNVLNRIYNNPGRYFLKLSFTGDDGHAIGIVSRSSANPNGCFIADVDYGLFRSDDRDTFLASAVRFKTLWHDCSRLEIMKVRLP